jgi:hypothetical protein
MRRAWQVWIVCVERADAIKQLAAKSGFEIFDSVGGMAEKRRGASRRAQGQFILQIKK